MFLYISTHFSYSHTYEKYDNKSLAVSNNNYRKGNELKAAASRHCVQAATIFLREWRDHKAGQVATTSEVQRQRERRRPPRCPSASDSRAANREETGWLGTVALER